MPAKKPSQSGTPRKLPATTKQQKGAAKKSQKQGVVVKTKPTTKESRTASATKAAAQIVVAQTTVGINPIIILGTLLDRIRQVHPEFRVKFARPDDLLVCDFIFDNLKLQTEGGNLVLVPTNPALGATLIVELPPQSFGEQAFLDVTGPEVAAGLPEKEGFQESFKLTNPKANSKNVAFPDPKNKNHKADANGERHDPLPFAKIRMAGRSRIAFTMPAAEKKLAFTLEAILEACRRWPMHLDVNALPESEFLLFAPTLKGTSLNIDWLKLTTSTPGWNRATQTLIDAVGASAQLPQLLTAAAKRIAPRAIAASSSGGVINLNAELNRLMSAELNTLAIQFAPLRQTAQRETAFAALSLLTTKAISDIKGGEVAISNSFLGFIFAPHKPASNVTALELPYRLLISPIPNSGWWHETNPVSHNGRTELWHTRLTNTTDGIGADWPTKIRALWSPDYHLDGIVGVVNSLKPYRMSLDPLDREMLVKLTCGFNEKVEGKVFVPRAARSQRLTLSALGALLDVEGNWESLPDKVALEQWRHSATLGRDHYVRVVYKGFLFPFGHSASLIKVTERKFEYADQGKVNRVAMLRQRFFIVVREPVKKYSGAGHKFEGRNFPFASVEILTRVTPNLMAPDQSKLDDPANIIFNPSSGVPNRACFWPMVAGMDFSFQIAATDVSGSRVTFAVPLLFVGKEANENAKIVPEIISSYNAAIVSHRSTSFSNQAVCYAPLKAGTDDDNPRLPTAEMIFDSFPVTNVPRMSPQFYPQVETAQVGITAIRRLLRQPHATVFVAYPKVYKEKGFNGSNPGEIFLKTIKNFSLEFGGQVKSDTVGALASPSMAIQGLSRIMGPVGGRPPASLTDEQNLDTLISNNFHPADFFKGAKILGGINLSDLIRDVVTGLGGKDVPKLLSQHFDDRIEASFKWTTKIEQSDPLGLFVPSPDKSNPTDLQMSGVVSSPIAQVNVPPTFRAAAEITNFKINLFDFIVIWFKELSFISKSGSKPHVAVQLHPGAQAITFGGPLEFVNNLRDIIPSNGFSNSPHLAVTPSGISAKYSLNVPSLAVGIFALEHVSLGASFSLPFDAKPAEVHFNFAERQHPFSLTVAMLGGGGFFAIGVGTEGVNEIEAALEFGASLSIDLGAASGSVEIKAGVYFHWLQTSVELSGYVRLHGELTVIGLISASLTFNLQLAYLKESGRSVVWGEASLSIEVDILFFSFYVSVHCRREFGGSNSDPKFGELMPKEDWDKYCNAFAKEAA